MRRSSSAADAPACFRIAALSLAALGALAGAWRIDTGRALASDEAGFKAIEVLWKKWTKNHDDMGNRERRKLILQSFDFRDLKTCRKFLHEAWAEERLSDNRSAVVQVLGATGDPKELEFLLGALRKEKEAGPQISLALGVSYTDAAQAAAVAQWAAAQLPKLKGEPL